MKMYFIIIVIIFALFAASCSQPTDSNEDNQTLNDIYGTWVMVGYEDRVAILRVSEKLDYNQYGFIFQSFGRFTERKNTGWCGTPPISYVNYEGGWNKLSDSLLKIKVGYWGGTTSYQMEIVSLSSDELKILYHYDE
jgi:hypothetical protein